VACRIKIDLIMDLITLVGKGRQRGPSKVSYATVFPVDGKRINYRATGSISTFAIGVLTGELPASASVLRSFGFTLQSEMRFL
jgi:hypothetical protein